MERITDEQIEKARRVPITTILALPEGRRHKVRCPFHNERTASFVLYPDGSYHCFGCSVNGQNAIDFVMEMGSTFQEAVIELSEYT